MLVLVLALAAQFCDDPLDSVRVHRGAVPIVVSVGHAGKKTQESCETHKKLPRRVCEPELDTVCQSGPCRTTYDINLDRIGKAFAAHIAVCAGDPTVVINESIRNTYDVSRDVDDPGAAGMFCAVGSPEAVPFWRAFYAALDVEVQHAVKTGGPQALLLDVHTYGSLEAAPPPSIILGSGRPFGSTMKAHYVADEWFGADGVRARLLERFRHTYPTIEVWPQAPDVVDDELFSGRFLLAHESTVGGIDALQLELSSVTRDDPELAAFLAADALCEFVAARASAPPPTAMTTTTTTP